jgi:hypothetical protein
MELLDFDDAILQHVAAYLGHYGALRLRRTCARMRTLIAAPVGAVDGERAPWGVEPRKRTPQRMWRWAARRGYDDLMTEACDAGARDLARYLPATVEFAEARAMWCATFARDECMAYRLDTMCAVANEIIREQCEIVRGNTREIARICASCRIRDAKIAQLIGKYAGDDEVRRAFANHDHALLVRDEFIYGAARSGRDALARELIAQRVAHDVEYICELVEKLLSIGRQDLLADIEDRIPREWHWHSMFDAATRGGRKAYEYAREHSDHTINIIGFLASVAATNGSAMCGVARESIDAAVAENRTPTEAGVMRARDFVQSELFKVSLCSAISVAALNGNRAACEYLHGWLREIATCTSVSCASFMYSAIDCDSYWIVDLIMQWSRDSVTDADVLIMREKHPLCDAVIRASLARM